MGFIQDRGVKEFEKNKETGGGDQCKRWNSSGY